MENKKQKTIYLNMDDEINSVIDKIRKCEANEITLALPENAVILQDLMNLKILRMNAKELKKNISIVTVDNDEHIKTDNEINESSNLIDSKDKESESKIKIHDIIKRNKDLIGDETKETISANQEIKKEMEKNLLRQEKFDQSEIKIAEDNKNTNVSKTNDFEKPKKQNRKINLLPSLSSRFFAGFIAVCFITTLAILGFVLPKSDIVITLKTEALTRNFEFAADELIDKVDAVSDKIPSEKINITNDEVSSYPTTGKKHVTEKAVGKITVYNECSTGPRSLKVGTRFLSQGQEGKIFKIKKAITIPGFTKPEDKIIPGSVLAEVVAEGSGESYNIGKTSFTIPKLQEINSWTYGCLYARSENSMSGGIDKEVLYFSDSDYLTAKEKLTKIAKEKNDKEFSDKILDKYILLEYLEQDEEVKIKDGIKVGDIADDFQMTISLKTSALLVAKDDLDNLINEKISSSLNNGIELVEGSREYEIVKVNKDDNKKISMSVFVSQDSIAKIDVDKIKSEIAGKNESELREYFVGISGIKTTDVGFWPFWVRNIPSSPDKINITIDINNSI